VAARLEALAEPGGICTSGCVHEQAHNRVDAGYRDLGEHTFKNVRHRSQPLAAAGR
jgi:class 3 adenylate cyclase